MNKAKFLELCKLATDPKITIRYRDNDRGEIYLESSTACFQYRDLKKCYVLIQKTNIAQLPYMPPCRSKLPEDFNRWKRLENCKAKYERWLKDMN